MSRAAEGLPAQPEASVGLEAATELAALVRLASEGDVPAFGQLYRRHVERIHRFVGFRVADPAIARDLTHDIFLRALRAIAQLERSDRFEAWLLRIANHTVQNHYRSLGRRPVSSALESADRAQVEGQLESSRGKHDPETRIETSLRLDALREAIRHLSPAQQEVLGLRFVAGLSFAETAEVTGRGLHAVRKLQYRGLAELRAGLAAGEEEAP